MRYQVVTLGTATRDVYIRSDAFRIATDRRSTTGKSLSMDFGAKFDLKNVLFETGGGATNTAVTFARLGFKTAFLGAIGRDVRGRAVLEVMEQEGVDTALVTHDPVLPTAYSLILSAQGGERTVLIYRGASARTTDAVLSTNKRWRTRWLYATSVGGNCRLLRKAFALVRQGNGRIAWNPGAGELQRGLRALAPLMRETHILLLNRQEAQTLIGKKRRHPLAALRALRAWTPALLVVTDGTRGAWASDGRMLFRSSTHRVRVADTTGAGDAFGSGFLAGTLKREHDVAFALQLGTANAEATIQIVGAKNGLLERVPPARAFVSVTRTTLRG